MRNFWAISAGLPVFFEEEEKYRILGNTERWPMYISCLLSHEMIDGRIDGSPILQQIIQSERPKVKI
jgi:hypothetical protein